MIRGPAVMAFPRYPANEVRMEEKTGASFKFSMLGGEYCVKT